MPSGWFPILSALSLNAVPAAAHAATATQLHDRYYWPNAAIGAVFISLYACGRFNTPPTSRSSTTVLRYYIGVTIYVLAVLAVYALVVDHETLAVWVLDHAGLGWADPSSFPLLLALLLTSSVEVISPLSKVDELCRRRFHRLASIPYRARHLSDELRSAPFEPSDSMRARVTSELQDAGFALDDVAFGDAASPQQLWTRLTVFLCRLRSWRGSEPFGTFYAAHDAEMVALEARYNDLAQQAHVVFNTARRDAAKVPSDWSPLVEAHRTAFIRQVEALVQSVCDLMSRGILECGRTERARDRELEGMGFTVSHEGLTLDQLVAVFLIISGLLTLFIVVLNDMPPSEKIALAIGASLSNWFAVLWAIEPRERQWAIAQRDRPDFRPIKYYAVVGLGTAGSAMLVRAFSRVVKYGTLTAAVLNARQWVAWVFVDVATAVMIAVNIDNTPRRGLRWIEAAAQGLVSMAVAWFIWWSGAASVATSPRQVILRVGVFGFALGCCVPSWYRNAPHEAARPEDRPADRRTRFSGNSLHASRTAA